MLDKDLWVFIAGLCSGLEALLLMASDLTGGIYGSSEHQGEVVRVTIQPGALREGAGTVRKRSQMLLLRLVLCTALL